MVLANWKRGIENAGEQGPENCTTAEQLGEVNSTAETERQAPAKFVSMPGTWFATAGTFGRTPVGRMKGLKNGQSGGMHVIRYTLQYVLLSAGIAVLWYGFRVGRAWWEMP